jgi:hypothetical protein
MTYKTFYEMFLAEMPQRINSGNDFDALVEMLRENLKYNDDVTELMPSVFKTQNDDQITYWVGDSRADLVSLIVDTEDHGNFRKVVYTAKNPQVTGAIFASDMMAIIKNDSRGENLVFRSDEFMSDDAIKLWQRLSTQGHHISVFDTDTNKYVVKNVTAARDLKKYFGDSASRRFVFVMSESIGAMRGLIHSVALMELKRQAGYPLNEIFENYLEEKRKKC